MDIIPQQNLIIPTNAMHGDTHWCAAGIHCVVPNAPAVPKKHHCPYCMCRIHGICGVVNPDSESMVFSQICHFCHEMNTAAEGPSARARANASRKATEKASKKMTPKKKSTNLKKKKAKQLNKNAVVDKVPGESFH